MEFHEMVYDNDPDLGLRKGSLKARLKPRRRARWRFIGFTGQRIAIHLKMLAKPYAWDTAQMPINLMDAHYRSFQK